MSLYQEIRGALQNQLAAVSGVPAIAYEGAEFDVDPRTPFVAAKVVPSSGRPATAGTDHLVLHDGLFQITLFWPLKRPGFPGGTAPIESMADAIKEAFSTREDLTVSTDTAIVRTRYAERGPIMVDNDWLTLVVSVAWYLYDTRY